MQHDRPGAFVADSTYLPATGGGALEGIDSAVKDCFAVKGHTSSFGSSRWRDTHGPSTADSAVVARLRGAGSNILGLTELDQLAFSLVGDLSDGPPPLNPRNPGLYCGGSSSGSAAAVASGMVPLGIGTDTAGSTRVPAALCGIHGLRPTWGAVDLTGCLPLAPSLDTAGLLAAHPAVMRRALSVLGTGGEPEGAASDGAPFHTVLVDPRLGSGNGQDLLEVARAVAGVLGARSATVEVGYLFGDDVADLFTRIQGREVWAELGSWVTENEDALDPDVARRMGMCRRYAAENAATVRVDMEDRRRFAEILAGIVGPGCVLVTPVLGGPGPGVGDPPEDLARFRRRCLALAAPAGLAGWPQIVWSRRGVAPVEHAAVGLLARPGSDAGLVDLLGSLCAEEPDGGRPDDGNRSTAGPDPAGQVRSAGGTGP